MTESLMTPAYQYRAEVVRWVDGDTVDLKVDLGFKLTHTGRFRLDGIDTPERGAPGYAEATAFCNRECPPGTTVLIDSDPPMEKYGRYLVTVRFLAERGLDSMNSRLLRNGLAVAYYGGKKL